MILISTEKRKYRETNPLTHREILHQDFLNELQRIGMIESAINI